MEIIQNIYVLKGSATMNKEFTLSPHGSPFGGPGPHGDLFQFLGPHWVPISVLRSPFSLFRA